MQRSTAAVTPEQAPEGPCFWQVKVYDTNDSANLVNEITGGKKNSTFFFFFWSPITKTRQNILLNVDINTVTPNKLGKI